MTTNQKMKCEMSLRWLLSFKNPSLPLPIWCVLGLVPTIVIEEVFKPIWAEYIIIAINVVLVLIIYHLFRYVFRKQKTEAFANSLRERMKKKYPDAFSVS